MSKIEEIGKLKKLLDDGALSKDQYDLFEVIHFTPFGQECIYWINRVNY